MRSTNRVFGYKKLTDFLKGHPDRYAVCKPSAGEALYTCPAFAAAMAERISAVLAKQTPPKESKAKAQSLELKAAPVTGAAADAPQTPAETQAPAPIQEEEAARSLL